MPTSSRPIYYEIVPGVTGIQGSQGSQGSQGTTGVAGLAVSRGTSITGQLNGNIDDGVVTVTLAETPIGNTCVGIDVACINTPYYGKSAIQSISLSGTPYVIISANPNVLVNYTVTPIYIG